MTLSQRTPMGHVLCRTWRLWVDMATYLAQTLVIIRVANPVSLLVYVHVEENYVS